MQAAKDLSTKSDKEKKAIFTHRLTSETTQKIIGIGCYVPLCRGCYNKVNEQTE
jgi:hypothetical protein